MIMFTKIMKAKRRLLLFIGFVFVHACIFAQDNAKVSVGILNGPSCIPIVQMMDSETENYSFEKYADPQGLLPKLLKNEVQIGFLPLNVAAKVYNSSNKKIKCIAITGTGNLSLITKNKTIKRLSQLNGKSVSIAGQGATPEYIFRFLLEKNNLSYTTEKKDNNSVLFDFSIPTANLVPALISGKIDYAIVPEPFSTIATIKDKSILVAIDLQQEFEDITKKGNTFPLTVLVATKDFCEKNPAEVQKFLTKYEKSYEWVLKNPAKAGKLCEEHDLGLAAGVVTKSIPRANYTFVNAADGKESCEELLNIFLESEKSSIGGKLPDSGFYFEK